MPEAEATVTRTYYCWHHEDDDDRHQATADEREAHRQEYSQRHDGHTTDCDWCYPDHPGRGCGCDACYEDYPDPDDEESMMTREWRPGPHAGDDEQGEYIQPGRTVGVEFERGSYEGTPGWENRILPEVGIGSDHCGMEVRTPPAAGAAADRFTRHTLQSLIDSGTSTGNDSGLHVHVYFPEGYHDREQGPVWSHERQQYVYPTPNSAADRQVNTAMARFLALWTAVEHIAFRFCPERRNSSWSRQVNRNRRDRQQMVNQLVRDAQTGATPNWAQSRYSSVNAMQSGYKTIEFRGHSSTNEVEHVMAWVAFVQGVVELSQRVSYITILRISDATSHQKRAQLLMQAGRRHGVWTDTAYAAIRKELGLSAARPARVARAA